MTDMTRKPLTGRRVFIWLAAFFLLIIVMNLVMVYLGNRSWTGLTTDQAYDKGVKYNEVIEQAEQQAELGWSVRFDPVVETSRDGEKVSVRLSADITGKDGTLLTDLEVTGRLVRPTSEGHDQIIEFSTVDGRRYEAVATFPLRGKWDVYLTAANMQGTYQIRHRIQLP
jgi:nitrogen fixation protein FixH